MYLSNPSRGLGDVSVTDVLSNLTTPSPVTTLSPLMTAGLGLLFAAWVLSAAKKPLARFKRAQRKRAQKRERIASLKSELKQLRA